MANTPTTPLATNVAAARPGRAVALELGRTLWRRFRRDTGALPSSTWRRWGLALAVGAAGNAVASAAIVLLAQAADGRGLQAWDEQMLQWLVAAVPLTFENGINWESPGSISYLAPLVIAVVLFAAWLSRPLIALSMIAIYILQHAFIFIGWGLWNRPRPELIAGGVAAPDLHSFPSGHAALSMSVYGFLAYLWLRASRSWLERAVALVISMFWIVLVGISRIELGSHWPSDVLGGFLIGLLWLVAVVIALRRAETAA